MLTSLEVLSLTSIQVFAGVELIFLLIADMMLLDVLDLG